jgi:hypothetical protein
VDGATSVIMTLNLVAEDYAGTRDFAVIDTNRADVAAIVATFNADFAGKAIAPPDGTDLVWSPTNAKASVLSVINGATRTLAVENEEMDDSAVTSALAAGAHIRLYPDDSSALYIHAKAIVADAGRSGQRVLSARRTSRCPATASADGYSHSYETNGSGYALIYLNGPPAGVRITVTVGGATCSTSD